MALIRTFIFVTNGHVEDVFYQMVRDKRRVRLEKERRRRRSKEKEGEKKLLLVCKPY